MPKQLKRIDEIRERDKLVHFWIENLAEEKTPTAHEQAILDRRKLLGVVDTQAAQIEGAEKRADNMAAHVEVNRWRISELEAHLENAEVNRREQIAVAVDLLVNWTLDYVREDPGQVFINECKECRNIIDEWNKGHEDGCEVGEWLKEVADVDNV